MVRIARIKLEMAYLRGPGPNDNAMHSRHSSFPLIFRSNCCLPQVLIVFRTEERLVIYCVHYIPHALNPTNQKTPITLTPSLALTAPRPEPPLPCGLWRRGLSRSAGTDSKSCAEIIMSHRRFPFIEARLEEFKFGNFGKPIKSRTIQGRSFCVDENNVIMKLKCRGGYKPSISPVDVGFQTGGQYYWPRAAQHLTKMRLARNKNRKAQLRFV